MSMVSKPQVLAPAAAAAGIASSLIALGFGLMAFVAGVTALSGQGAAVLFAPFAAVTVALVCGMLGLLPALVWVISAVVVGPPILQRLQGPARGTTLALACTAPAYLAGRAIADARPFGASFPIEGMMGWAVIGGGLLAGAILAWFVRETASPR